MDQKIIGIVVAAFGVLLILISISFTQEHMARGMELHKICSLDPAVCPFIEIPWQGMFSIGIGALYVLIGLLMYLKPFGKAREVSGHELSDARKKLKGLEGDERDVFNTIIEENGMIFQSTLMEKTGLSKVKVTRVLDKLENKKLVERKRRGMTNVVVLR
jgi:uncharacterized membrane protein